MEEFILHTIAPVFLVILLTGTTVILGILLKMMLEDIKNN